MRIFIITRFNISSPGRERSIRNCAGWLDRRFDLFEKYCLPSVACQTYKDFEWIIYFDVNTPDVFRRRIEQARKIVSFTPLFVEEFTKSTASNYVNSLIRPTDDLIVTIRLDNDDAIALTFVERARQEAALVAPGTVLNFKHGLTLNNRKIYTASGDSTPFTALVETARPRVKTIWSVQHQLLKNEWRVHQINGPPFWIQVIHGENVANRIKGRLVLDLFCLRNFEFSDKFAIQKPAIPAIIFDWFLFTPFRQLRECVLNLIKPFFRIFRDSREM